MPIQSLIEADRQHLIHPVINYRAHEARGVTVLESASGAFLRDAAGNELLDAFSGLWCVNVGYGQQSIVEAATAQMQKLPYATSYFHFGCEPAIELAQKLAQVAPASLQHVYFTLGGSDAVDSAIRFITHYFNATGRPSKKHIIALQRGYHGSSSIGAGLTALPAFHRNFDVPLIGGDDATNRWVRILKHQARKCSRASSSASPITMLKTAFAFCAPRRAGIAMW